VKMSMTEEEWLANTERDITKVIRMLSLRRQRLLAAAACRALLPWINYPAVNSAIAVIETFADTGKTKAALHRARQAIQAKRNELRHSSGHFMVVGEPLALFVVQVAASENAVDGTLFQAVKALPFLEGISLEAAQRKLYKPFIEICGFVIHPALLPEWQTSTVIQLARQMYDSRDFSAMPILADALQDAGCDNSDILGHCRGPGPHTRGCWVVDLLLRKA
jgi:hypothetical protein